MVYATPTVGCDRAVGWVKADVPVGKAVARLSISLLANTGAYVDHGRAACIALATVIEHGDRGGRAARRKPAVDFRMLRREQRSP